MIVECQFKINWIEKKKNWCKYQQLFFITENYFQSQRKTPENVDYLLQHFSIVLVRFCVSCKNCSVMDYERFLCIIYLSHTDRIMMMSSDQWTVRRKFPVDDDAKTFILPTYFENETTTRVCVLWRKSHKIPPSLNREII